MKKFFVVLPGLLFFIQVTWAQNNCSLVLKAVQKTYDEGKIGDIPQMLSACLKNGFTKTEKVEAYRLIVLSYLFNDQPQAADSAFIHLLKADPEYTVNPDVDPEEFIDLSKKFRTNPLFSIGVMVGANYSMARSISAFGVNNTSQDKGTYHAGEGFFAGLTGDFLLYKNFYLNVSALYATQSFSYTKTLFHYSNFNLTETQSWIQVPLAVKYEFGKGKTRPLVEAGASFSYLLTDMGNFSRKNSTTGSNEAVGPQENLASIRNSFVCNGLLGVGLRQKLGYGYFLINLRYLYGFTTMNNPDKRYSNNTLIYKYGYIDNNFSINDFMISISYLKSIYKPKKVNP